jgi:hypothetical protein
MAALSSSLVLGHGSPVKMEQINENTWVFNAEDILAHPISYGKELYKLIAENVSKFNPDNDEFDLVSLEVGFRERFLTSEDSLSRHCREQEKANEPSIFRKAINSLLSLGSSSQKISLDKKAVIIKYNDAVVLTRLPSGEILFPQDQQLS